MPRGSHQLLRALSTPMLMTLQQLHSPCSPDSSRAGPALVSPDVTSWQCKNQNLANSSDAASLQQACSVLLGAVCVNVVLALWRGKSVFEAPWAGMNTQVGTTPEEAQVP